MIDYRFEHIGHTAQRGFKVAKIRTHTIINNYCNNINVDITSLNSSGKRSREAEVAISRFIVFTFLISQLSTRT
jgi:hypothetical protein